jgi:hypothetical protein
VKEGCGEGKKRRALRWTSTVRHIFWVLGVSLCHCVEGLRTGFSFFRRHSFLVGLGQGISPFSKRRASLDIFCPKFLFKSQQIFSNLHCKSFLISIFIIFY